MSKQMDPHYENWLLRIRKDLRRKVEEEAAENTRTAPQQIEFILRERYSMPALSGEDADNARAKIKKGEVQKSEPRPRKISRKALRA